MKKLQLEATKCKVVQGEPPQVKPPVRNSAIQLASELFVRSRTHIAMYCRRLGTFSSLYQESHSLQPCLAG